MKKILIVDDDPMVRQLVRMSLAEKYTCVEAPDGETGLDLVESEKPDNILLDWVLPGRSGLNFFQQLQRMSEYRSIPIIIISARGEQLTRVTARELGAAGYLVKPFDLNDLRDAVARVSQSLF